MAPEPVSYNESFSESDDGTDDLPEGSPISGGTLALSGMNNQEGIVLSEEAEELVAAMGAAAADGELAFNSLRDRLLSGDDSLLNIPHYDDIGDEISDIDEIQESPIHPDEEEEDITPRDVNCPCGTFVGRLLHSSCNLSPTWTFTNRTETNEQCSYSECDQDGLRWCGQCWRTEMARREQEDNEVIELEDSDSESESDSSSDSSILESSSIILKCFCMIC